MLEAKDNLTTGTTVLLWQLRLLTTGATVLEWPGGLLTTEAAVLEETKSFFNVRNSNARGDIKSMTQLSGGHAFRRVLRQISTDFH